jgi:membrane fusion protein (multidrug efflux system)
MMKRRVIVQLVTGCCIALLAGAACGSKKAEARAGGRNARNTGPLEVEGFRVEPASISDNIEVPGSLLPAEQTQIRAEVNGRVVALNLTEGNTVRRGALLVKLFDGDLQAQLKKLQVQLQIAQKTEERQRKLLDINGISQQEYELTALNTDNLEADIQSTRIAIDKTEIRAPYAGTLGLRNISLGTFISPSDVITTLRQVNVLKLEFAIPEKYAATLQRGAKVGFRVEAGRTDHTATVLATENSVDAATRTLRVKALVDAQHRELVPGSFATVNLQLGRNNEALMVPTQAIIPQARNKQLIVYKGDSVRFTTVVTGIRDSSFVQVLSGIAAGDTVITTGIMAIRPGSKINLVKVTALPRS